MRRAIGVNVQSAMHLEFMQCDCNVEPLRPTRQLLLDMRGLCTGRRYASRKYSVEWKDRKLIMARPLPLVMQAVFGVDR